MCPHGINDSVSDAVPQTFDRLPLLLLAPTIPDVGPLNWIARLAISHTQPATRRQGKYALIERPWLRHAAPKIESSNSRLLRLSGNNPGCEERLDLRGKDYTALYARIVEWLDAIGIARHKQLATAGVPDG